MAKVESIVSRVFLLTYVLILVCSTVVIVSDFSGVNEMQGSEMPGTAMLHSMNYSREARSALVEKYAERYGCQWYESPANPRQRQQIVSAVSQAIVLPLCINHFCQETSAVRDTQLEWVIWFAGNKYEELHESFV